MARGNNGEFLEGGCGHLERVTSSLHAEALAAFKSLQRVAHLEKGLRSNELDRSGGLFRQIRDFIHHSFAQCVIWACPRSCNKVADSLAAHGASVVRSGSEVCMDQVSDYVTSLVSGDLSRVTG